MLKQMSSKFVVGLCLNTLIISQGFSQGVSQAVLPEGTPQAPSQEAPSEVQAPVDLSVYQGAPIEITASAPSDEQALLFLPPGAPPGLYALRTTIEQLSIEQKSLRQKIIGGLHQLNFDIAGGFKDDLRGMMARSSEIQTLLTDLHEDFLQQRDLWAVSEGKKVSVPRTASMPSQSSQK